MGQTLASEMEFKFDLASVLRRPISIFSADDLPRYTPTLEKTIELIDELGVASAKAQELRGPVTTAAKLKYDAGHRVYILKEEIPISSDNIEPIVQAVAGGLAGGMLKTVAVGMIKVGQKNLYMIDEYGRHLNIRPLSVLDFYIHENYQRKGYGRKLFDYMLMIESESPGHLAYDRPSSKFLQFLKKYYNLSQYIPQVNNFVIFKEYGLGNRNLNIRGKSAEFNPKLQNGVRIQEEYSQERTSSITGESLNSIKNQPAGNARRFSALLCAKELLNDVDKKPETIYEEQSDYYSEKSEAERSIRSSITSNEKDTYRSNLLLESQEQSNDTGTQLDTSKLDQFPSLSDYWKHQADRRQSRIGELFSVDPQKWNRIGSQVPPKVGIALTPRQKQLLSISQRENSGNSKSAKCINTSNSLAQIGNRRLASQKLY